MDDYDKAKLLAITDFITGNFRIRDKPSLEATTSEIPRGPIEVILSRSGTMLELLLLKKAMWETTLVSGDYRIGLVLLQTPHFNLINELTGEVYCVGLKTQKLLPDLDITDNISTTTTQDTNFHEWYFSLSKSYTKFQLLDTLSREFPYTNFGFLS